MKELKLIRDRCGFFKISPTPSEEELAEFYSKKYYQVDSGNYQRDYEKWELDYFEDESKIIDFFLESDGSSILDLGCGEGFQSAYFRKKGHNITCVDYSEFGLKRHNPELVEYFIRQDIIEFLKSSTNKYDLILLKNVLEHVPQPRLLLELVQKQMHKGSILYIDVPNDFSEFQEFLLSKNYTENTWLVPPEHLNYFQNNSLNNLLQELNFNVVSSQGGFPIELFLTNKESNYFLDRNKGRNAHKSRCEMTNFLSKNMSSFIKFRETLAETQLGRNLVFFATLKK